MAYTFEDVLRAKDAVAVTARGAEVENSRTAFRFKIRQKFGPLWQSANESVLFSLNLFRSGDDDDLAAISLAIHQITLDRSAYISDPVGNVSCHHLVAQAFVPGVSVSVAELHQATGIPRETIRRKLTETGVIPYVECGANGQGYQLSRLAAGLFSLLGPALCLAGCLESSRLSLFPRSVFELPALPFLRFISAYLRVVLCVFKLRRMTTRTSICVSVKTAMAILTGLKVSRLAMVDCTVRGDSAASFLAALPQATAEFYYLTQISGMTRLPISKIRRLCRGLEQDGALKFVKEDIVRNVSFLPNTLLNRGFEEVAPIVDGLAQFEEIFIHHRDELCNSENWAADAPMLKRQADIE